ncbi:MAG: type VII toxin-antitoxin system HepT family RNase toxin [Candidatus Asgardarchaeia archaeon]
MKPSVERRIIKLHETISKLEEIKKVGLDNFINSRFLPDATERLFQVSIEILVDFGNYIIRKLKLPSPETYTETFKILCEHDILPLDMRKRLEDMARFRNRLVHGYISIDKRYLFKVLEDYLDFIKFIAKKLVETIKTIEK